MSPLAVAFAAALFAAAAWGGTLAAHELCSGRVSHADGPEPVRFARWPFAAAGAAIGIALVLHGEPPARLALLAFAVLCLAGCAAADFACGMLPDLLTLAPLAVTVATALAAGDVGTPAAALLVALPFAGTALVTRGRGMGWGDVKLAALGGALLGAFDATVAFTVAALLAYLLARRSGRTRAPIAFGPYLAGSIAATLAAVAGGP